MIASQGGDRRQGCERNKAGRDEILRMRWAKDMIDNGARGKGWVAALYRLAGKNATVNPARH